MAFNDLIRMGASNPSGYEIERSLRFSGVKGSSNGGQLDRTFSGGNPEKWTFSWWMKVSQIGTVSSNTTKHILSPYRGGDGSNESTISITSDAQFRMYDSGATQMDLKTTRLFRDVGAWMHCVVAVDTTQATPANRVKVYFNGVQETDWATETYPAQNYDMGFNKDQLHRLGAYGYPGATSSAITRFGGYLTEIYFIDDQQLTASSFGENDSDVERWIPKEYEGTYGDTGFYLNFSDNSGTTATTLGKDYSGEGNNWTPANFSVAAGVNNDSFADTPTNNYPTLNPLNGLSTGFYASLNSNLDYSIGDTAYIGLSTIAVPTSGKWYAECTATDVESLGFGLRPSDWHGGLFVKGYLYLYYGKTWKDNTEIETVTAISDGDIVGCAVDRTAGTVQFSLNGTNKGSTLALVADEEYYFWVARGASSGGNPEGSVNFGQRAFSHQPTGFKGLCTKELPEVTITDGRKYFDIKTYTGTGSSHALTGLEFQPNLVYAWRRNASGQDGLMIDSERGGDKSVATNSTAVESTNANRNMTFQSNGVTWTSDSGHVNASGGTYVNWYWKEAPAAGFDIITYTGNDAADRDISHSLNAVPEFWVVKARNAAQNWFSGFYDVGKNKYLLWESYNAAATNTVVWSDELPTSAHLTVGEDGAGWGTNENGDNYIGYLFSSVKGYSKIGSFIGNGSTNGPFVYTGFRPRFILTKKTDGVSHWYLWDSKRNPENQAAMKVLWMNYNSESEGDHTAYAIDFLSNGFKVRNDQTDTNTVSSTQYYLAFAEAPIKYANAR